MIRLKSCPRCQTGDIVLDGDFYGRYIQCLQCGYIKDVADDVPAAVALWRPQHAEADTSRAATGLAAGVG